jgi:molybdopterin synthase sulfur carrier subunit
MSTVHLRYWAGAKAAAGRAEEVVEATTVAEALALVDAAHADDRFSRVVRACSVLVDGATAHEADLARPLDGPVQVELLPPFAGGAVGPDPARSPARHQPVVCRTSRGGVSGSGTT